MTSARQEVFPAIALRVDCFLLIAGPVSVVARCWPTDPLAIKPLPESLRPLSASPPHPAARTAAARQLRQTKGKEAAIKMENSLTCLGLVGIFGFFFLKLAVSFVFGI